MITKIEVGSQGLTGIDEVQEIVQNEGDYLLKGLIISLRAGEQNTMSFIETVFSGDVGNIKVYGKEQLPATEENTEITYGEEKLLQEYVNYDGMKSIYYDVAHKRFTVSLSMSAANIADAKYQKLLEEQNQLEKTDNNVLLALAEQFENFNNAQNEILLALAEIYESIQANHADENNSDESTSQN